MKKRSRARRHELDVIADSLEAVLAKGAEAVSQLRQLRKRQKEEMRDRAQKERARKQAIRARRASAADHSPSED